MSGLVGLDGRSIDSITEIATPDYLENAGTRAGLSAEDRAFMRANIPGPETDPLVGPPKDLSRSGRQIYALRKLVMKAGTDNLQLWMLVGAFCELQGGVVTFTQEQVKKFIKPENWPAVVADKDNNIRIAIKDLDEEGKDKDASAS